ncbi:Cell division control protein 31 [Mycena sanguinolenta]|uniref:Cell division control protein 31 n=1 Tax=Mycena sanguinolenta TaxID=230812 RepID=A0A8H7CKF0_9AGAR|nr:Cell division control protein 31 [Mycena sanguinolenta]
MTVPPDLQLRKLRLQDRDACPGFRHDRKKAEMLKILRDHDNLGRGLINFDDSAKISVHGHSSATHCTGFNDDNTGKISLRNLRRGAKEIGDRLEDDEFTRVHRHYDQQNLSLALIFFSGLCICRTAVNYHCNTISCKVSFIQRKAPPPPKDEAAPFMTLSEQVKLVLLQLYDLSKPSCRCTSCIEHLQLLLKATAGEYARLPYTVVCLSTSQGEARSCRRASDAIC